MTTMWNVIKSVILSIPQFLCCIWYYSDISADIAISRSHVMLSDLLWPHTQPSEKSGPGTPSARFVDKISVELFVNCTSPHGDFDL